MFKKSAVHRSFPALFPLLSLFLLSMGSSVHAASPLELSVETAWLSGRADGNETEQITVRYDSVMHTDAMSTDENPLQEAFDMMNGTEIMKSQSYLDWYLELFETYREDGGTVSDFTPCSYYHTALIKRADTTVTSILYQTEAYAGGAHPNTFHTAYNFRSSDGAELSLGDVFSDFEQLREALYGQLSMCYPDLDLSPLDDIDMESLVWVLDHDGLTVYLGEYVIGALYDGFQTAHFSYEEYESYFADWVLDIASDAGTELGNYEPTWRDLDESGVPEVINVGINTGEGTEAENNRYLTIYYSGEYRRTKLPASQDVFTTLIDYHGAPHLYIEASQDLDLSWIGLYRLDPQDGGTLTYIGSECPSDIGLHTSRIMIQYPIDLSDTDAYRGSEEGGSSDTVWNVNDAEARTPFYGVWISASKDLDASWALADLIQADGVTGWVFNSSEWSNLNPEPWYIVTAGVYYTYEEALTGLERIQAAGYTNAYIKYSGDPVY